VQQVHYPSGLVLEWDDTLSPGELITAADQGFHLLTGFEFREGSTPLVQYVLVVREDGTRVKKPGVTRTCDAVYVRRVSRQDVEKLHQAEVNAAIQKRDNLLNFVPQ
jgi:hypothetical protein